MFSSACVASRKPRFEFREAETIRPCNNVEINANDVEDRELPVEEEEAEARERVRGREESEEEGAKRRKFLKSIGEEEVSGDREGGSECSEQDAGDFRNVKKLVDPKLPSREEVEAHEMTHLPYRNWCRHCVMGRGVEAPHKRAVRDVGAIPKNSCGFLFPRERRGQRSELNGGRSAGQGFPNDVVGSGADEGVHRIICG